MNANLLPKTPVISEWLRQATIHLISADINSAKLDAELILSHTLRKPRTFLHAHGDEQLAHHQYEIANARLRLRCDRTPLAYIVGHKEFYGRSFQVTPATLIPRPESEMMITMFKELQPRTAPLSAQSSLRLIDVGTGSGCLGITAKLEQPEYDVTLLDISRYALSVAEHNAIQLHANITTIQSDLLIRYPLIANVILANLPYVDRTWKRSIETNYEPSIALFAEDNGLELIKKLIKQSKAHLSRNGILLLEADPRQHHEIIQIGKNHEFTFRESRNFIICLENR